MKSTIKILSMLLACLLVITACSTGITTDAWESLDYNDYSFSIYSDLDNYCGLYFNADGSIIEDEYFINSDEEFQALLDLMEEYDCEWYDGVTEIDFDNYSLLSNWAGGTGCETNFIKDVQINDGEKLVIYSVTVEQLGGCEPYASTSNWILVEKIPDDYTVLFTVNTQEVIYYY